VPYPWPWYGPLDPNRVAMVVVTSPQVPGDVTPLATSIAAAAEQMRSAGAAITEVRTAGPLSCRPRDNDSGARDDRMAVLSADYVDDVVTPLAWDGFHGTPLDALLRAGGRDTLVLAGWWLEVAVHSTMRSANDRGYECLLATDLVAALDPVTAAGAISSIHMSGGIFGATGESTGVLAALARCSE
jgi:nicotinamidase-related amidase